MSQEQQHFSIRQAVTHQRETLGYVVYGEDSLYAMARRGGIKGIIRVGAKRTLLTRDFLERLLAGEVDTYELAATA